MDVPLIVISPFSIILDNWERFVYILVILFLIGIIIFFKININNNRECSVCICGYKLTTKDFIYTHLLALLFLVVIVTSKYGDSDDLVRYVSFATTIVSLFLSLIAIILSIVSLPQIENITSTMNSSVESLNNSAIKISEFQEKMNAIVEESKKLNEQVIEIEKITKSLKQQMDTIGNDVGEIKERSHQSSAVIKESGDMEAQNTNDINFIEDINVVNVKK